MAHYSLSPGLAPELYQISGQQDWLHPSIHPSIHPWSSARGITSNLAACFLLLLAYSSLSRTCQLQNWIELTFLHLKSRIRTATDIPAALER
jgi:hypothetical protein